MSATTFSAVQAPVAGPMPAMTVLVDKTKTIGNYAVKNASKYADKIAHAAALTKAEILKWIGMVPTSVWLGLGAITLSTEQGYHKAVDLASTALGYAGKAIRWCLKWVGKALDWTVRAAAKLVGMFSDTVGKKAHAFADRFSVKRQIAEQWLAEKANDLLTMLTYAFKGGFPTSAVVWTSRFVLAALLLSVLFPPAAAFLIGLPLVGGLATASAAGSLLALKIIGLTAVGSTAMSLAGRGILGVLSTPEEAVTPHKGMTGWYERTENTRQHIVTQIEQEHASAKAAEILHAVETPPVMTKVAAEMAEDKDTYTVEDVVIVNGKPMPVGEVIDAVKAAEAKADSQHRAQPRKGKKH